MSQLLSYRDNVNLESLNQPALYYSAAPRCTFQMPLTGLDSEQHFALAQIVGDALLDTDDRVQRAAAWIVGELEVLPDDAIPNLRQLFAHPEELVRMAGAWAAGELALHGVELIPDLVAALDDPDEGVRFAATCALGEIERGCEAAVPRLIEIARDGKEHLRAAAIEALGVIAPDNRAVQALLIDAFNDKQFDLRAFSTVGFVHAKRVPEEAIPLLSRQLQDKQFAIFAGWALGACGTRAEVSVPDLLRALSRIDDVELDWSPEGSVVVNVHNEIGDALQAILPMLEDTWLHDFRLHFFRHAFHPHAANVPSWIDEIVGHRWYRKMQRASLRRQFHLGRSKKDRLQTEQLLTEAETRFAERLWRNPTLGLVPERYRELPGYVFNHARKVAWQIRRRQNRREIGVPHLQESMPAKSASPNEQAEVEELMRDVVRFIEMELPEELRHVVMSRLIAGWTIAETAHAHGITESQVKTAYKKGIRRVRNRFRHSLLDY